MIDFLYISCVSMQQVYALPLSPSVLHYPQPPKVSGKLQEHGPDHRTCVSGQLTRRTSSSMGMLEDGGPDSLLLVDIHRPAPISTSSICVHHRYFNNNVRLCCGLCTCELAELCFSIILLNEAALTML